MLGVGAKKEDVIMPERKRSQDGSRDTEKVLGDRTQVSQQGRGGGTLASKIGTRDEMKRAKERPGGASRVKKSDEIDGGKDRSVT